jgi:hypothetical protein
VAEGSKVSYCISSSNDLGCLDALSASAIKPTHCESPCRRARTDADG